jgi:hypothetical protein
VVYGREVNGKRLTLGVSGKLWRNSLVMFDRETGTLWSQITGEAVEGPLKGARLPKLQVSDRSTTLESWKVLGPRVLQHSGTSFPRWDTYADYHASKRRTGIRPTETRDSRLPAKASVLGISLGGRGYTLPLSLLPVGKASRVHLGEQVIEVARSPRGVVLHSPPKDPSFNLLQLYWFVWSDFSPRSVLLTASQVEAL